MTYAVGDLIAFPFQSSPNPTYDDDGNPMYDRAIDSVHYRQLWNSLLTDGIFVSNAAYPDDWAVTVKNGMTLNIKLGFCVIQGLSCFPYEESLKTLTLDPGGANTRVDRIVIQADFSNARRVDVAVIKNGDMLTRNENMWQLAIADVTVPARATSISAANIDNSLRLDPGLCGQWHMRQPMDFNAFLTAFNAFMAELAAQKASQQTIWTTQMTSQQNTFNTALSLLQAVFNTWWETAKVDIATYANFDFDNIAALPGTKRITIFNADGSVSEMITTITGGASVALRTTAFPGDKITLRTIVYRAGTILRDTTTTADFNTDGSIVEATV
ncbi:MAG: hypothetical protein LBK41_07025 [Clostridiales bacterium]|jgi:hypothetical protein|nr:hypothetical protein [Clostridiales bacterium]